MASFNAFVASGIASHLDTIFELSKVEETEFIAKVAFLEVLISLPIRRDDIVSIGLKYVS